MGVSRGLRVIAAERERRERESELGRAREERGHALGFGVWGKAGPGWGAGCGALGHDGVLGRTREGEDGPRVGKRSRPGWVEKKGWVLGLVGFGVE